MAARLSRRELAQHVAAQLVDGNKVILDQLAAYLIDTKRTGEAELIVRDVETALQTKGTVIANITSANELTSTLLDAITKNIAEASGATAVQVRTAIDPSLIGGVKVRTPDAEYDGTVRRKLTKLQAMKV